MREVNEQTPVTILQLAEFRIKREPSTGDDFAEAGLQIMGGCERCHASIAAYNACPSKSGNWRCDDCIGDDGFATVSEANEFIFGGVVFGAPTPEELLQDPSTPFWAQDLIKTALTKDPVDAANVLEVVAQAFVARVRS